MVGTINPASSRNKVVLPAPLGPSRAASSSRLKIEIDISKRPQKTVGFG